MGKAFPVRELVKRGCFRKSGSDSDNISDLLEFFAVESVDAYVAKYGRAKVAYRHSPSFKSSKESLATWLRLGEIKADRQSRAEYDEGRFAQAAIEIRHLTRSPINEALPEAQDICSRAGVALVMVKPLPKIRLSGAAWWPSPERAIIQLSMRHKSDDHLWFSFFHEVAHILLHKGISVFVDDMKIDDNENDIEAEANQWASDMLINRGDWDRFVANARYSEHAVKTFADQQGIAPGIVVGRLQHEHYLSWGHPLSQMKIPLKWSGE